MNANVGGFDRTLRIGLGVVLLVVFFSASRIPALAGLGGWVWLIGAVGLVMLATGAFRFCPAYMPFGVSTCDRR